MSHPADDAILSKNLVEGQNDKSRSLKDSDGDGLDKSPGDAEQTVKTPGSDEEGLNKEPGSDSKKKKHRRGRTKGGKHRRKWKPYNKLSWEERQEVDEAETKRACMKREERFASGHPVAPYNTTQFIMEDRQQTSPSLKAHPHHVHYGDNSDLGESSEDYDSPGDDVYLEKDFAETYENFHAERLQAMCKEELINEYIALESRLETTEHRLSEMEGNHSDGPRLNNGQSLLADRTAMLQQEVRRLQEENSRLKKENTDLQQNQQSQR